MKVVKCILKLVRIFRLLTGAVNNNML